MGLKCCVHLCNSEANSSSIRLHSFPKDEVLCEKWVTALQKDYKFEVKKSHRICSKHFDEQDFIKSTFGNLMLKPGSIPKIFVSAQRSLFKENVPNTLLYKTDKNNFVIELQKVLDDLLNDEDTADFGKCFKSTYSHRAEKWAYFNRKHVGINTNMYFEALHKSIKYCYLEGKNCKRLDLSINALMSLARDKSFKRIIKISKQKMSHKLTQIIAAHNKSTKITPDMVVEVNGNWLVNSETDIHTQYRVKKTTISCECLLRCNICKICVHTYKCTCINNVIYFNICKHIHACAKRQTVTDSETVQNENQSLPLPCDIAVDNGFLQKQKKLKQNENIMKNNEEIKNKLEMILGMHSRANMNEEDQMYIIKQCDNMLTMLGKKIDFKKTSNLELTRKRKIEPQARFISKKKVPNQHLSTLSSIEGTQIRESLKNSTKFLTISTTPAFDHSYL